MRTIVLEESVSQLSIVIPTYNDQRRLHATLITLAREVPPLGAQVEVIVVDDGSTDGTADALAQMSPALPQLKTVFVPRSAGSCRARARNVGARTATGQLVLFLDAGVLAGPSMLRRLLENDREHPGRVTICKLLGVFAPLDATLDDAPPEDLVAKISALARLPSWSDVREPHLHAGRVAAHALPAWWLLAWTGALAMPREPMLAVGGFDEAFEGWGAEDVDLAARLARLGLGWHWLGDVAALYVPHARTGQRAHEHRRNALRMHHKLGTRETELFAYCLDGFAVNILAARLDRIAIGVVLPETGLPGAAARAPGERLLCMGLNWSEALEPLHPDAAVVHEPSLLVELRAWWPGARLECLLGVLLPFADSEFDRAFVGDFVRLLSRPMRLRQLLEASRVAVEVSLFVSTRAHHQVNYARLAGWNWASERELMEDATSIGLRVQAVAECSPEVTELRLRRAPPTGASSTASD